MAHLYNDISFMYFGTPCVVLILTYSFLMIFAIRPFILKRYEEDTNLAETEPLFAVLYFLMDSKAIRVLTYTTHLLLVILTDKGIIKKRGHLKNTPIKEMLTHFSKRERTLTIVTVGCGFLGMALGIVFLILNRLWK